MTDPFRRVAVAIALIGLTLAGAPGATAQPAPAGVLALKSQTTWWLPDQPFSLELTVQSNAPDDLEVAVSIFRKVPNRTEFATTVEGRTPGRAVEEVAPVALADLAVDAEGDRTFTFIPVGAGVRAAGVYPVRIDLRPRAGPSKPVATLVTHLVHVPATLDGGELEVGVVLPLHAPPAVQPDGRSAIDDARAEQLAEVTTSIEANLQPALSLAPTPETVDALGASPREQDRATLSRLTRGLGDRQLLGGPFVPNNLTSVLQAGLDEESAGQLTRGTESLRSAFGREPTTAIRLIDERLTAEAVEFLQSEQQVLRLVVPEGLLEPVTRRTTLTNSFQLEGRRGSLPAMAADAGLAAHFAENDDVLGAQHLLADLAVLYNDDPAAAKRGVVATPARTWQPSGAFVATLLAGLETSPILEDVTLDQLFERVAPATSGTGSRIAPLLRKIAPPPPGSAVAPSLPASTIGQARRRVDAFASAVDPANPVLDRLDRTLLASQSSDLRARDRIRYLEGVEEQVGDEISRIAMPQNRSITLTAREGEIPVTITSTLDYPLKAVLRVASDTLEFPDGDSQQLDLVRRNTTSQFTVQAQSSGSFPLRVRLESPEGLVLAESRFTVRSTAISGVGTALSIGAGLFLLVWWGNHLRVRRSRRLVPS